MSKRKMDKIELECSPKQELGSIHDVIAQRYLAKGHMTYNNIIDEEEGEWIHSSENNTENQDLPLEPKKKKSETDTTCKEALVNINDLRDDVESNAEWDMRRRFLEVHFNSFSLDRLICLSSCFINHEIYGCTYPRETMILLQTLRCPLSGFIREQMDRLKSKYAVSFVKQYEPKLKLKKLNEVIIEKKQKKKLKKKGNQKKVKKLMSFFVKAGQDDEETDEKAIIEPGKINEECGCLHDNMQGRIMITFEERNCFTVNMDLQKFETNQESNSISRLYEAAQKSKIVTGSDIEVVSESFVCKVFFDNVLVGVGNRKNQIAARSYAHSEANKALLKQYKSELEGDISKHSGIKPNKQPDKLPTQSSFIDTYKPVQRDMNQLIEIKDKLPNFFLQDLGERIGDGADDSRLLFNTCQYLHVTLHYNKEILNGHMKSKLLLNGLIISEAVAAVNKTARREAARIALSILRDICWTLVRKQPTDCESEPISKYNIMKEYAVTSETQVCKKLTDSNIGSKLMRKMGWTGEGIGKTEQGRVEPVTVQKLIHRSGLGSFNKQSSVIKDVVRQILKDYALSDQDTDIVFASDFSKEECSFIHVICRQFKLRGKNSGKKKNRSIVISRIRTPAKLFEYVKSNGGETMKYKLIPPNLECFKV